MASLVTLVLSALPLFLLILLVWRQSKQKCMKMYIVRSTRLRLLISHRLHHSCHAPVLVLAIPPGTESQPAEQMMWSELCAQQGQRE